MDDLQKHLIKLVEEAIHLVYRNDQQMILDKANERSIVFRLGLHLNERIGELGIDKVTLDCEYNRRQGSVKRLAYGEKLQIIIPDILIHRRGEHGLNLLAIEVKGEWNGQDRENDFAKLRGLTDPEKGYAYHLGVHLELEELAPILRCFVAGIEVNSDV